MPDSFMRIDAADFKVWDQPDSKVLGPSGAAPTSAAGRGCSPPATTAPGQRLGSPLFASAPGTGFTFGHTVVDGMDDKA